MERSDSTCWSVIRGAAAGTASDREDFVRRYDAIIRTYLTARWRQSNYLQELDDAVQEVYLECFRQGGILGRVGWTRWWCSVNTPKLGKSSKPGRDLLL